MSLNKFLGKVLNEGVSVGWYSADQQDQEEVVDGITGTLNKLFNMDAEGLEKEFQNSGMDGMSFESVEINGLQFDENKIVARYTCTFIDDNGPDGDLMKTSNFVTFNIMTDEYSADVSGHSVKA